MDRIEALRDAGTISDDEARQLIDALGDEEAADEPPGSHTPATEPPAKSAAVAESAAADGTTPPPTCSVHLAAAEVTVTVADIPEPHCEGDDVICTASPDGSPLGTPKAVRVEAKRVGLVEGWIGRSTQRSVKLTLPPGWDLQVELKAGSVCSRGVERVRGRILAGSWEVDGANSVDLTSLSGNVKVALRPQQGDHRVEVSAGDASVTFLPGSDVAVEARVDVGRIQSDVAGATRAPIGVGERWSGRLGEGRAKLQLRVKAGGLELRHQKEEG